MPRDIGRNWATILYPESAKENWLQILEEMYIPVFISPLHDQDVNPGGEKKKEHFHIMFMFEGNKSKEQIKEICDEIGAVGLEKVKSIRSYARYLCHLDNPDKYRYNEAEVICLGGSDYSGIISLTIDKYLALGEMQEYIRETGTKSFAQLADYARAERFDWYRILCDCGTIFIKEYLKSYAWEGLQNDEQIRKKESHKPDYSGR